MNTALQKVVEISHAVVQDLNLGANVSTKKVYAWQYNGCAPWYVIRTYNQQVAAWLRSHPQEQRAEYGGGRHGNIFDVREDLYLVMSLKWANS